VTNEKADVLLVDEVDVGAPPASTAQTRRMPRSPTRASCTKLLTLSDGIGVLSAVNNRFFGRTGFPTRNQPRSWLFAPE